MAYEQHKKKLIELELDNFFNMRVLLDRVLISEQASVATEFKADYVNTLDEVIAKWLNNQGEELTMKEMRFLKNLTTEDKEDWIQALRFLLDRYLRSYHSTLGCPLCSVAKDSCKKCIWNYFVKSDWTESTYRNPCIFYVKYHLNGDSFEDEKVRAWRLKTIPIWIRKIQSTMP